MYIGQDPNLNPVRKIVNFSTFRYFYIKMNTPVFFMGVQYFHSNKIVNPFYGASANSFSLKHYGVLFVIA
jgi:hypothetical protein